MIWTTAAFSAFFLVACLAILIFLPADNGKTEKLAEGSQSESELAQAISDNLFGEYDFEEKVENQVKKSDEGLYLYRQPEGKAAVEWFYTHVTNSREVTLAILKNADLYNIPLSLAFSLAHTESNYKTTAKHVNKNQSIDRGLFQLNNRSFPSLKEEDFYDPEISAKFGMSHLRFCLDSAGNEIAALAMYNAGTNKVRNDSTPQMTLNYISQIENYRGLLESNFASEVLSYYNSGSSRLLAKN